MSLDRRSWVRVAWALSGIAGGIAGLGGCRPTFGPEAPPPEPGDSPGVVAPRRTSGGVGPGRRILVGEMCPLGVAGRPGMAPLLLRGVQWTDEPAEVGNAISHAEAAKFSVFGVDGKRAGVFTAAGIADVGLPQTVAAGSYAGSGPCTYAGAGGAQLEEPKCQAATKGCGIGVAVLGDAPGNEGAEKWRTGGACVNGDQLAFDVDGDGNPESFPIAGLLDGMRAPADLVESQPEVALNCTAEFMVFGMKNTPPPDAKAGDARYQVLIDVLAAVDFDGDGGRELVLGLRYPDSRTIAVYSSSGGAGGPASLRLIGEVQAWAR